MTALQHPAQTGPAVSVSESETPRSPAFNDVLPSRSAPAQMTIDELGLAHAALQAEATILAGCLTDLAQRATVYHHIYEASGGNHVFPLIAAHGALWARGWFSIGLKLGRVLSWQSLNAATRSQMMDELNRFADTFREINRRVCIDTWTSFHFTGRFGDQTLACEIIDPNKLAALNSVHSARRNGLCLSDVERRKVFEAFFLSEQRTIVEPAIQEAVKDLHWPLLKAMALRPYVRFAYMPGGMWFRNFSNQQERIERGMHAFDTAAQVGWKEVEAALHNYRVLPAAFLEVPGEYYEQLRSSLLSSSPNAPSLV
jgi:hypothetical protein